MKAKLKKSTFVLDTVEYLNHKITNGTIVAHPKKPAAISHWPEPQTVNQLQKFLGLTNYYNRFMRQFAEIAAPLTYLVGKNSIWQWEKVHQEDFDNLKKALTAALVLLIPDFTKDFSVETDTIAYAISAVLMQKSTRSLQPVQYFSRKLKDAETRYAPHDHELVAIVSAFDKFRPYV